MSRAGGDPLLVTKVEVQADLQPMEATLAQAKVEAQAAAADISTSLSGEDKFGVVGGKRFTSLYDTIAADAELSASRETRAQQEVKKAYDDKAKAVKGADQEIRSSLSRILGVAGVATAATAAIDRLIAAYNGFKNAGRDVVAESDKIRQSLGQTGDINAGLSDAEKKAIAFAAAMRDARKEVEGIRELGGVVDGVNKVALGAATAESSVVKLGVSLAGPLTGAIQLFNWYNKGTEALEDQAEAALKKAEADAKGNLAASESNQKQEEQRLKQIEQLERIKNLEQEISTEQIAALRGADKIQAEYNAKVKDLEERKKKATGDELNGLLRLSAAIERRFGIEYREFFENERKKKEAADKQEQEERKRAERQAQALTDAYTTAIGRVQQEAIAAFSAERLTGAVETLLDRVEAIAEQRRNIRG